MRVAGAALAPGGVRDRAGGPGAPRLHPEHGVQVRRAPLGTPDALP